MKKRLYVLPCLLALLLSSGAAAETRLTNAPGDVVARGGPLILSGHFEIRPPNGPSEPSIDSSGGGGACLIAEPVTPQSCNASDPCSQVGNFEGAYCIKEGGFGGSGDLRAESRGTCWVQPYGTLDNTPVKPGATPDNDPCTRGVTGEAPYDTPNFDASAFFKQTGATKWRVYSCLNGPPGACRDETAVERVTVLHRAGPISEFPIRIEPLPLRNPIWIYISIALAALVLGLVVFFRRRARTL